MAKLWVKICGLRERADVAVAAAAGADAVGLVFHAPSPRNVSLEQARELRASVPAGVDCVAVFLHPSQALVDAVLEAVRPDWLQADAEDLVSLRLPAEQRVLQVLRSGKALAFEQRLRSNLPARCLFESARSGAGERADWSEAARLARRTQLVLAGGLESANVADAVRAVRPFGVDVSSGVERERGVKDAMRIREFIRAAREAERALSVEECR
jgi:phosphoribosylanthranilate isomerase